MDPTSDFYDPSNFHLSIDSESKTERIDSYLDPSFLHDFVVTSITPTLISHDSQSTLLPSPHQDLIDCYAYPNSSFTTSYNTNNLTQTPITFNQQLSASPGYSTYRSFNVKLKMQDLTGRALPNFSLGTPSSHSTLLAVGTNNLCSNDNYLICIDHEIMSKRLKDDPIVMYCHVSEHIRDIRWLSSSTLLSATGAQGRMQLFNVDPTSKQFYHTMNIDGIHSSYIREMAIDPSSSNIVVSGGNDHTLCLSDLNHAGTNLSPLIQRVELAEVVGSVKWSPFNNGAYIGVTLDSGVFFLVDGRQQMNNPAVAITTNHQDLFCNEMYNDYNVLLGYGDSEIRNYDIRKPNEVLDKTIDPYVEGIGQIHYHTDSQSFVVSGYTDFTVWKQHANGDASVWSHSVLGAGSLSSDPPICIAACFMQNSAEVVCADSTGHCSVFVQQFDY